MKTIWRVSTVALALGSAMSAWAATGHADASFGLRLPDEGSAQIDMRSQTPRLWVSHLLDTGRQWRKAWRTRVAGADRVMTYDEMQLRLFRSRHYATLNWEPVTAGSWKLGAALGVMRDLPGPGPGGITIATFPMATYEQPNYRFNMGWLPAHGERDSMVLMRVTMPLH